MTGIISIVELLENIILSNDIISKIVLVNGCKLEVFSDGRVYRFNKHGLKLIKNTKNHSCGYNYIKCNNKMIFRHRIIGYAFLNLDIDNPKKQMDHIDGNRLNNQLSNLRIVTHQQNQHNQVNAKGYSFNKSARKYQACIHLNNKTIYLGLYDTADEAHNSYLEAKKLHHVIQSSSNETVQHTLSVIDALNCESSPHK